MRVAIILALALILAGATTAQDFGHKEPVKQPQSYSENIPLPERQGGDTIGTATVIPALPYSDSGTTAGRFDDYDEVCPYSGSIAPDVVYKYVATSSINVDIDLCNSSYDTKVYVYDAGLNLIACNDDFYFGEPCGEYVSKIESLTLQSGTTYYIIVDGYGNASGNYSLEVDWRTGPYYTCPPDGQDEGEPPLVDGYVDEFNGGCNTPPEYPFQEILGNAAGTAIFCGLGGWYVTDGSSSRDTDWFRIFVGATGIVEIEGGANYPTYLFELWPQDCDAVGVLQQVTMYDLATMTIGGYQPGAVVWIWAGSTVFSAPPTWPDEYLYVLWFSGLLAPVPGEATTWSTLKALYD